MKKYEKGFTVVEGLLAVLILAVLGFIGYYVWTQNKKDKPTSAVTTSTVPVASNPSSTTTNSSAPPTETSYTVQFDKFSFQYPAGWLINDSNPNYILLRGPNDFVLSFSNAQGLGGSCGSSTTECSKNSLSNQTLATLNYYTEPLYVVLNGVINDPINGVTGVTVFKVIPEQTCYYNTCYGYQGKNPGSHIVIIQGAFADKNGDPTYVEPSKFISSTEVQTALKILGTIKY